MYILSEYEKTQVDTVLKGVALDIAFIMSKSPAATFNFADEERDYNVDVVKASDNRICTIVDGRAELFSVKPHRGLVKATLSDVSIRQGDYRNKLLFLEAYQNGLRDELLGEEHIDSFQKRIGVR